MDLQDLKLTIIEHPDGVCTAWMDSFKGLIVQTNSIDDVPKEIAKSVEVMLMYGFDKKIHTVYKIEDIFPSKE